MADFAGYPGRADLSGPAALADWKMSIGQVDAPVTDGPPHDSFGSDRESGMDAVRLLRVVGAAGVFACLANTMALAQDGVITADVAEDAAEERPSLIQRVGHIFSPVVNWGGHHNAGIFPHFGIASREIALWPSPDSYVDDRRCEPRPWAPRGYGVPKHTSCYRMDYAPYKVQHHESDFGPAYWLRNRREPCHDTCGHGEHCRNCLHDGVQP